MGGVAGNLKQWLLAGVSLRSRLCVHAYLVAQALGGDNSDLIADALVGLEVESEARVVALDDDLGRLLDRLSPDATHFDRCEAVGLVEGVDGGGYREVGGALPTDVYPADRKLPGTPRPKTNPQRAHPFGGYTRLEARAFHT